VCLSVRARPCTCERSRVFNFLQSRILFFSKKCTRSPRPKADDGVCKITNGNARITDVWNVRRREERERRQRRRTTILYYYYHSSGKNETVALRAGGRSVGDAIIRIQDEPLLVRQATTTTAAAVNARHKYNHNLRLHSRPR